MDVILNFTHLWFDNLTSAPTQHVSTLSCIIFDSMNSDFLLLGAEVAPEKQWEVIGCPLAFGQLYMGEELIS